MEGRAIGSWKEFEEVAIELDGWAFRGHRVADWRLLSSLSRHLASFEPKVDEWDEREARALRVFRRKAHNYLSDPLVLDDDLRCLALMQHHGAPTRLLDFTKSPFVAAFFALQRATGDSAVYAVNTPVLWSAAPSAHPDLTRDKIDPRFPGNFNAFFAGNRYDVIWTGEPNQLDKRLVAQSGTFVLPGVISKTIDEILGEYPQEEPLLLKLILPATIRAEAMRALYRMNITNATLFPDLDGLAKSMAFELEIVWKGLAAQRRPQG